MRPLCSNCKFWHKIGEMPGRPGNGDFAAVMPPKPRLRQRKRSNTRHGPPRQKMSGVVNINRRSRLSPNIIRLYEK